MKKYKVVELANILGISEQAIRSKVKRNILPSVEENIDNRVVTLIPLDNDQLNNLISRTNRNKNIYPLNNTIVSQQEQNIVVSEKNNIEPEKQSIDFNSVLEYMKQKDQQLEKVYSILLEKEHNIGAKEKQIFLLEDSESRTKREFAELSAKVKQLEKENQELKNQINKKSGFLGLFKK